MKWVQVPPDRKAPFWFEEMKEPRLGGTVPVPLTEPERLGGGATHVAIWVPYEQAEARVAAALAAGGRMVRDEFAPAWWTLANQRQKEEQERQGAQRAPRGTSCFSISPHTRERMWRNRQTRQA